MLPDISLNYLQLLLKRLLSLWVLLSDEILGVLSSTDLLTGTLDLESTLSELAREAGEFFTAAYFSLGEDPRPVKSHREGWREVESEKNKIREKLKHFFMYAYKQKYLHTLEISI